MGPRYINDLASTRAGDKERFWATIIPWFPCDISTDQCIKSVGEVRRRQGGEWSLIYHLSVCSPHNCLKFLYQWKEIKLLTSYSLQSKTIPNLRPARMVKKVNFRGNRGLFSQQNCAREKTTELCKERGFFIATFEIPVPNVCIVQ